MAAKPTVPNGMGRAKIREVLNMAPGYGKTEDMLHERVGILCGGGVSIEQIREWLEWNLAEDYVRREENQDTDEIEWYITEHGQAKERIK
jgi:hypothetical protein